MRPGARGRGIADGDVLSGPIATSPNPRPLSKIGRMNKLLPSLVLVAAVSAFGCNQHKSVPDTGERVTQVGIEDAPKAVRKGVARDYPGASITRVERVRENGLESYVVYLRTTNDDLREIRYSLDGNKLGNH